MNRDELLRRVNEFPTGPGVYLFKDSRGRVLYIGKAANLRSRVRSYFTERPTDRANIEQMMPQVATVDFLEAESEVDALLLESRLIKDIRPKYNIEQKDGKSYPYIEITIREDFPRVALTREPAERGTRLFGPFTDVDGARTALQVMQRVFRFRTCALEIRPDDPKMRYRRPCLLHYINQCSAPCAGLIDRETYRQDIRALVRFLGGRRRQLIDDLRRRMESAAAERNFERAADLRDQIRALESLDKRGSLLAHPQPEVFYTDPGRGLQTLQRLLNLPNPPRVIEGVDIATTTGQESVGAVVTFLDGKPFKNGYRRYRIRTVEGIDDYAMIREVVSRRFNRLRAEAEAAGLTEGVYPDILLVDGGPGQLNAAIEAIHALGIVPPTVLALAKREELVYRAGSDQPLRLSRTSPALKVLQYVRDEAHRFASHYHHILRGKRILPEKNTRSRKKKKQRGGDHSPPSRPT